jgi:hypothetical protein
MKTKALLSEMASFVEAYPASSNAAVVIALATVSLSGFVVSAVFPTSLLRFLLPLQVLSQLLPQVLSQLVLPSQQPSEPLSVYFLPALQEPLQERIQVKNQ